jgi:two-component system NtrC family response regulator
VASILVIDDDIMMCQFLVTMGKRLDHEVVYALSCTTGLETALSNPFDVVLLDLHFPDGDGLDILPAIRETPSRPEVIIISGAGDPDGAELAIRNGAWDYLQKPATRDAIQLALVRAIKFHQHKTDGGQVAHKCGSVKALKREGIVGESPKMKVCLDHLAQAASSTANVVITGETGTGKELFAWAIHENSSRSGKPFVVVDCAALTESLVENALFGHGKGAFTGADNAQDGMIRQADGGTLFLDEVGELPLSVQKAFLRVLHEHRFRPLGGKEEVHSDFRLITATNRDLDQMVQEGRFRKDLFFRLRSLAITLPPLRDRTCDINDLAMYHLAKHCERYGSGIKGLSTEFFEALFHYDWPGNVRELVHAMESSLISAGPEPTIFPNHLPIHIRVHVTRFRVANASNHAETPNESTNLLPTELPKLADFRESAVAEVEKHYLQRLISLTNSDIKETCRVSGLSRSQLYSLLKKHRINRLCRA